MKVLKPLNPGPRPAHRRAEEDQVKVVKIKLSHLYTYRRLEERLDGRVALCEVARADYLPRSPEVRALVFVLLPLLLGEGVGFEVWCQGFEVQTLGTLIAKS